MTGGYREEVFNVLLALVLHERGVISAPEQSFKQALEERRHVPDVLVSFRGLRTVIEGKVADKPDAADKALTQARNRVDAGIAHIGVALLYPAQFRKAPSFAELQTMLVGSSFRIAVCSEAGETAWSEGDVDYLADLLRRTFEQLVREDVVTKAVEVLRTGVDEFAKNVFTSSAAVQKAAEILGIRELPKRKSKSIEDEDE